MKAKLFILKYESTVFTVLRIVAGFLFFWHGFQKLFNFPPLNFTYPLYVVIIAGPVEFVGGLLILAGLWTRITAFICSGEMACAYWIGHGTNALLPLVNHGELAMLYCFFFLFLSIRGAGKFSLDYLLRKK